MVSLGGVGHGELCGDFWVNTRDESPQEIYLTNERLYFLLNYQLFHLQEAIYLVWINLDSFL